MAAVRMASENKLVEAILVHRVDRLARNVYSYLTLKTKLRQAGVRIVSYVKHFDANPMGEFLEHIMAFTDGGTEIGRRVDPKFCARQMA